MSAALDRHFSVAEIADRWGLSETKVREMFRDGVETLREERDRLIDENVELRATLEDIRMLLCPVHASLDLKHELDLYGTCVACVRNQRDELLEKMRRIYVRCVGITAADPTLSHITREAVLQIGDFSREQAAPSSASRSQAQG